jgi:competence protein ComGC
VKTLTRILGVLLVFIFGMIVGGVGASAGLAQKIREVLTGDPEAVVKVVVKKLDHELKLDAEQKRKLQDIADDTYIKLRQSRAKIQPEVDRTLGEAEERARTILYPNQIEKFDKLLHKGREKWKAQDGTAAPPITPAPSTPEPAQESR